MEYCIAATISSVGVKRNFDFAGARSFNQADERRFVVNRAHLRFPGTSRTAQSAADGNCRVRVSEHRTGRSQGQDFGNGFMGSAADMKSTLLALALLWQLAGVAALAAPPLPNLGRSAVSTVAPLSVEQQVQALQAQLAALQAVVRVTSTGNAGQDPTVTIIGAEVNIQARDNLMLTAASTMSVKTANLALSSTGGAVLQAGATLGLKGSLMTLNGGGKPLATVGSLVQTLPGSANGSGSVITGSQTVLAD